MRALADRRDYLHPAANPGACGKSARETISAGANTMKTRRIGVIMAAWLALLAAPRAGSAQENFPSRPVRIVIPYSPGSVADVFARIVGQNMAARWSGSVIVGLKYGPNGALSADAIAASEPED